MAFTRSELTQYAAKQKDRFEHLLKEFVEIPSVSADLATRPISSDAPSSGSPPFGPSRAAPRSTASRTGPRWCSARSSQARAADPDHLQPPRRRTGFEGDRALADGTLHVHAGGDTYFGRAPPTTRASPLGALRGPRRARGGRAGQHQDSLGAEEEVGSPNFAETLRAIGPAAATDAVVVSDTVWVSRGRPALSGGLRGLQPMTFRLETAKTDQHSGSTAGWRATQWPSWRSSPPNLRRRTGA